jgi:DNA-binding MarR family transcriptional regulator
MCSDRHSLTYQHRICHVRTAHCLTLVKIADGSRAQIPAADDDGDRARRPTMRMGSSPYGHTMSLRSQAKRPGPQALDATRHSERALDLDNYVPAYLTYLAGKISASASATYRPRFGVGISDWRIMALLATEPWITAGRICDVIGLDKAAVSRSVRDMKKAGIVETDEDQYRRPIALTRKGLALHDRMVLVSLERERRLLKDFSAAERKQLINLLSRMHAQIVHAG